MEFKKNRRFNVLASPWVTIGVSFVLISIVLFQTIMNYNREKKFKGFTPMAMGQYISEKDLPVNIMESYQPEKMLQLQISGIGGKSLDEIESVALVETLKQTNGNKTEAAKILNITRTTLNNKIKKYKLTI